MCTLIALWKYHPAAPLIVALNRDEFLARPTQPPHLWQADEASRPIVAGRDLQSGGTWFGVGTGVVAGLTNHRQPGRPSEPGERSRGELVVRALEAPDLPAARRHFNALDPKGYAPFHLLACDGSAMGWFTNRAGAMEFHDVPPGLHVLGNYGLNDPHDPVVANMKEALADAADLDEPALHARLRDTLAGHGPGRPCVHFGPYGTRSSAILYWGGAESRLWTTPGAPCQGGWTDASHLLHELAAERKTAGAPAKEKG